MFVPHNPSPVVNCGMLEKLLTHAKICLRTILIDFRSQQKLLRKEISPRESYIGPGVLLKKKKKPNGKDRLNNRKFKLRISYST